MGEMAAAGLATVAGEPVPLRGVAIHVAGRGPAARVTVAQSYVNEEAQAVEAVYTFPLPEEAAVAGFQGSPTRRWATRRMGCSLG